jgi:hypothetical protein
MSAATSSAATSSAATACAGCGDQNCVLLPAKGGGQECAECGTQWTASRSAPALAPTDAAAPRTALIALDAVNGEVVGRGSPKRAAVVRAPTATTSCPAPGVDGAAAPKYSEKELEVRVRRARSDFELECRTANALLGSELEVARSAAAGLRSDLSASTAESARLAAALAARDAGLAQALAALEEKAAAVTAYEKTLGECEALMAEVSARGADELRCVCVNAP